MGEFSLIAFMVLTFLELFAIIKFFFFERALKKYENAKEKADKKKYDFVKRMIYVSEVQFAVVMIFKVMLENQFRVPFVLWIIDVILMSAAAAKLLVKYVIKKNAKRA